MTSRGGALCGLGIAVVAISWGAPLARMAAAAPLAVAMWRLVLAAALLAPVAVFRRELPLPPGAARPALWAGALLAVHFGLWIPSLFLTSVSASVVLVTTTPLWVLLLSPRYLGVPIRASNLVTFALAIAGVTVISWGDLELSPRALLGDAMALGGAFAVAGYIVIGKRMRARAPLFGYLATVNGAAAAVLVAAVLASGTPPCPRTAISWLPLLGMAVGPTLVGHTMLNWALAHLEAYRVNLAVLLEPVGATLLTWAILGEEPPLHVVPGAALVLGGLVLEMVPKRGVGGRARDAGRSGGELASPASGLPGGKAGAGASHFPCGLIDSPPGGDVGYFRIARRFEIETGHRLSKHPEKCRFPHGHTRVVEVVLRAGSLDAADMVCDYKALKCVVARALERYDHAMLLAADDPLREAFSPFAERVVLLEEGDPTTEVIARHLFGVVRESFRPGAEVRGDDGAVYRVPEGVAVERVRVWETPHTWAEYVAEA